MYMYDNALKAHAAYWPKHHQGKGSRLLVADCNFLVILPSETLQQDESASRKSRMGQTMLWWLRTHDVVNMLTKSKGAPETVSPTLHMSFMITSSMRLNRCKQADKKGRALATTQ